MTVTLGEYYLLKSGLPSRTALAAAAHRAAHQVLEYGCIFDDPLALRILGKDAETAIREAETHPSKRWMRIFIAIRTRFAEDALAAAVEKGVTQLVILGAGLDTFAYRNPFGERLRVFEVDYPATQAWKRQRLTEAAIKLPDSLVFVPLDFERDTLAKGLASGGFDSERPTFFTWLGVVPYLAEQPIWSTLEFIAILPNGGHVVFDYINPPASFSPKMRIAHERRAAQVSKFGEAFISYFETEKLHARLTTMGFIEIEDEEPSKMFTRFFPDFNSSVPEKGGRILHATTILKPK